MAEQASILAIAGSARKESYNKKLLAIAAAGATAAGGSVTVIDLKEYAMPIYDGDLEDESGLPPAAVALRKLFGSHAGVLLASPEYNGSIAPLLKNTIDWVSRPADGTPGLAYLAGKTVALVSASPGRLGGLRGLTHLRQMLAGISMLVIPEQQCIDSAMNAFGDDGALSDEVRNQAVRAVGARLAAVVGRLAD